MHVLLFVGRNVEPGFKKEFDRFKKECELRKLINFDDFDCLIKVEVHTPSQLQSMFGYLYDV